MAARLLIVEDEETLRESLKRVLLREGYDVTAVESAESASGISEEGFFDLIITDIILPGITGIELLKKIKEKIPEQIIIIMTAYASLETAVEALRAGAYDYIVKPVMHEEIKQIVRNALRQGALLEENLFLRKQLERRYDINRIIGEGPEMKRIREELKAAADTKENVLVLGEIGTGKELIARAIHLNSSLAEKPFIAINAGAIPADEVDRTLFGFVKGSFPDSSSPKRGLLEKAHGGFVFIREIADMDSELQKKFLRLLETMQIRPVGGTQDIRVDFRFIASSNRDLEAAVSEGRFNEKLFRLLNGVTIKLPPLRERVEDIRPLVDFFIRKYSDDLCRTVKGIEDRALEYLEKYHWPGNVRELQNIIEHTVLISGNGIITMEDLPPLLTQGQK
jgi:DNA-binding NtrC family response regulator